MRVYEKTVAFDWDKGNTHKNRLKHGITPEESESVFLDSDALVIPDIRHSKTEKRFILVGTSEKDRYIFIVFTIRNEKIRIISSRRMHRKEKETYEKT